MLAFAWPPERAGDPVLGWDTHGRLFAAPSRAATLMARPRASASCATTARPAQSPGPRSSTEATGHQLFPDIAVDHGVLHALWWDSRNDPDYSPTRPVGSDAARTVGPSLDAYASTSTNLGASWAAGQRVTDVTSNPNYDQFDIRQDPFAGDYLWVDAQGGTAFGASTDWRDALGGTDPRVPRPTPAGTQVPAVPDQAAYGTWGPDTCPRAGGLDQNIYSDLVP